jgi:hypothetical protein
LGVSPWTGREQELQEHIEFLEQQLRYAMKILHSMMKQIQGLSELFKMISNCRIKAPHPGMNKH